MNKINENIGLEVTDKQLKVIHCVITCNSVVEACRKAQVSRTMYYQWLKDENFRKVLKDETDQVFFQARRKLVNSTLKACEVFIELLDDDDPNLRRFAAKEILSFAYREKELEIEERVKNIEIRIFGNQ